MHAFKPVMLSMQLRVKYVRAFMPVIITLSYYYSVYSGMCSHLLDMDTLDI